MVNDRCLVVGDFSKQPGIVTLVIQESKHAGWERSIRRVDVHATANIVWRADVVVVPP